MSKRVEGVYPTINEALAAVERLRDQGYGAGAITLVANAEVRSALPYAGDADTVREADRPGEEREDRSFWEKVKDAFTWGGHDDSSLHIDSGYEASAEAPAAYQEEIEQGHIVILVEEADTASEQNFATGAGAAVQETHADRNRTLELREERLDIDLAEVQTGEIRITKRVVEEMQTIDVPVTYEEITIERWPVKDQRVLEGDVEVIQHEDEIVIPVVEERVVVDKEVQVVEEVEIHRDRFTETERVTETLRREELDVDTQGSAQVEETRTLSDRSEPHEDVDRRV